MNMKKIIAILLALVCLLSFTSCSIISRREITFAKKLTCEEILSAYREAGYSVGYHNHGDPAYYDLNEYCSIEIHDPNAPEDDYMYITRYYSVEDAKAAAAERQFNPILWLFFGVFGEWRWLITARYGDTCFETFDLKMLLPLYRLIWES